MDDVFAARRAAGFVSPLRPVEPGKPLLICANRGHYEWMAHPDDAARWVRDGVVVDGVRLPAVVLEDWPLMGAVQVIADEPAGAGFADFVDSGEAA